MNYENINKIRRLAALKCLDSMKQALFLAQQHYTASRPLEIQCVDWQAFFR